MCCRVRRPTARRDQHCSGLSSLSHRLYATPERCRLKTAAQRADRVTGGPRLAASEWRLWLHLASCTSRGERPVSAQPLLSPSLRRRSLYLTDSRRSDLAAGTGLHVPKQTPAIIATIGEVGCIARLEKLVRSSFVAAALRWERRLPSASQPGDVGPVMLAPHAPLRSVARKIVDVL